MEYYKKLDESERNIYEDYYSRLNRSSNKEGYTPLASSRSNTYNRLPALNSFSSVLNKPVDSELVPKAARSKPKKISPKRSAKKKPSPRQLNGKFYTEKGLNVKHPDLPKQLQKVFWLIESHKRGCRQEFDCEMFISTLKSHLN